MNCNYCVLTFTLTLLWQRRKYQEPLSRLRPASEMMISAINDEGMSDFESSEESSMNDYAADQNAATDGEEELRLLHKENSAEVSRWRGVAIIMLFLTAAFVITTSYVFLSREETDEFEKSVSLLWWMERYSEEDYASSHSH